MSELPMNGTDLRMKCLLLTIETFKETPLTAYQMVAIADIFWKFCDVGEVPVLVGIQDAVVTEDVSRTPSLLQKIFGTKAAA